jgi:ATP synthase F1 gamma subunit
MTKKEITQRIGTLNLLIGLTEAYSQVSSQRMKKIRDGVTSSRDFLSSIDGIFRELRNSQKREVAKLAKKKGGNTVTFLAHNGKTASVFIAANAGLYGDIVGKVFNEFINEVRTQNTEVTIIGKFGLSLFLAAEPKRPYTYFDYPDYGDSPEDLSEITRHLVAYEQIHIHYGKFRNLAYQEPTLVVIAAETELKDEGTDEKITQYLFEPDLSDLLIFFEGEMFTSTFEQAIHEAQLAKFSSRMIAMDTAGEKVKDELKKAKIDHLKLTHYLAGKKQQSIFSSFHLWKGP